METKAEKTVTFLNKDVLKLYTVLSKIKVNKIEKADALKMIKLMVMVKPKFAEIQESLPTIRQTCLPEGLEQLEQKHEQGEALSKAEQAEMATKRSEFFDKFNDASKQYLDSPAVVYPVLNLSEDVIMQLHESNDITLDDVATLMEYLQ